MSATAWPGSLPMSSCTTNVANHSLQATMNNQLINFNNTINNNSNNSIHNQHTIYNQQLGPQQQQLASPQYNNNNNNSANNGGGNIISQIQQQQHRMLEVGPNQNKMQNMGPPNQQQQPQQMIQQQTQFQPSYQFGGQSASYGAGPNKTGQQVLVAKQQQTTSSSIPVNQGPHLIQLQQHQMEATVFDQQQQQHSAMPSTQISFITGQHQSAGPATGQGQIIHHVQQHQQQHQKQLSQAQQQQQPQQHIQLVHQDGTIRFSPGHTHLQSQAQFITTQIQPQQPNQQQQQFHIISTTAQQQQQQQFSQQQMSQNDQIFIKDDHHIQHCDHQQQHQNQQQQFAGNQHYQHQGPSGAGFPQQVSYVQATQQHQPQLFGQPQLQGQQQQLQQVITLNAHDNNNLQLGGSGCLTVRLPQTVANSSKNKTPNKKSKATQPRQTKPAIAGTLNGAKNATQKQQTKMMAELDQTTNVDEVAKSDLEPTKTNLAAKVKKRRQTANKKGHAEDQQLRVQQQEHMQQLTSNQDGDCAPQIHHQQLEQSGSHRLGGIREITGISEQIETPIAGHQQQSHLYRLVGSPANQTDDETLVKKIKKRPAKKQAKVKPAANKSNNKQMKSLSKSGALHFDSDSTVLSKAKDADCQYIDDVASQHLSHSTVLSDVTAQTSINSNSSNNNNIITSASTTAIKTTDSSGAQSTGTSKQKKRSTVVDSPNQKITTPKKKKKRIMKNADLSSQDEAQLSLNLQPSAAEILAFPNGDSLVNVAVQATQTNQVILQISDFQDQQQQQQQQPLNQKQSDSEPRQKNVIAFFQNQLDHQQLTNSKLQTPAQLREIDPRPNTEQNQQSTHKRQITPTDLVIQIRKKIKDAQGSGCGNAIALTSSPQHQTHSANKARQIKFHEYKGPPSVRKQLQQQQQQQQQKLATEQSLLNNQQAAVSQDELSGNRGGTSNSENKDGTVGVVEHQIAQSGLSAETKVSPIMSADEFMAAIARHHQQQQKQQTKPEVGAIIDTNSNSSLIQYQINTNSNSNDTTMTTGTKEADSTLSHQPPLSVFSGVSSSSHQHVQHQAHNLYSTASSPQHPQVILASKATSIASSSTMSSNSGGSANHHMVTSSSNNQQISLMGQSPNGTMFPIAISGHNHQQTLQFVNSNSELIRNCIQQQQPHLMPLLQNQSQNQQQPSAPPVDNCLTMNVGSTNATTTIAGNHNGQQTMLQSAMSNNNVYIKNNNNQMIKLYLIVVQQQPKSCSSTLATPQQQQQQRVLMCTDPRSGALINGIGLKNKLNEINGMYNPNQNGVAVQMHSYFNQNMSQVQTIMTNDHGQQLQQTGQLVTINGSPNCGADLQQVHNQQQSSLPRTAPPSPQQHHQNTQGAIQTIMQPLLDQNEPNDKTLVYDEYQVEMSALNRRRCQSLSSINHQNYYREKNHHQQVITVPFCKELENSDAMKMLPPSSVPGSTTTNNNKQTNPLQQQQVPLTTSVGCHLFPGDEKLNRKDPMNSGDSPSSEQQQLMDSSSIYRFEGNSSGPSPMSGQTSTSDNEFNLDQYSSNNLVASSLDNGQILSRNGANMNEISANHIGNDATNSMPLGNLQMIEKHQEETSQSISSILSMNLSEDFSNMTNYHDSRVQQDLLSSNDNQDDLPFNEFIDFQDVPMNVDESDWLKKFLPPCSMSNSDDTSSMIMSDSNSQMQMISSCSLNDKTEVGSTSGLLQSDHYHKDDLDTSTYDGVEDQERDRLLESLLDCDTNHRQCIDSHEDKHGKQTSGNLESHSGCFVDDAENHQIDEICNTSSAQIVISSSSESSKYKRDKCQFVMPSPVSSSPSASPSSSSSSRSSTSTSPASPTTVTCNVNTSVGRANNKSMHHQVHCHIISSSNVAPNFNRQNFNQAHNHQQQQYSSALLNCTASDNNADTSDNNNNNAIASRMCQKDDKKLRVQPTLANPSEQSRIQGCTNGVENDDYGMNSLSRKDLDKSSCVHSIDTTTAGTSLNNGSSNNLNRTSSQHSSPSSSAFNDPVMPNAMMMSDSHPSPKSFSAHNNHNSSNSGIANGHSIASTNANHNEAGLSSEANIGNSSVVVAHNNENTTTIISNNNNNSINNNRNNNLTKDDRNGRHYTGSGSTVGGLSINGDSSRQFLLDPFLEYSFVV